MKTARPATGTGDASLTASLTSYVADFIVSTRASDIPRDVAHLGKRSILDGLGLALAGAASETGRIIRRYLDSLGIASASGSTVIGGDSLLPARFAAFANGVSIHADDYDDTQLAIAKDRVYVLGRDGTCVVLKKGPTLEILATNKVAEKTDATIALAGRELFLRGHEAVYCITEE